MIAAIANTYGWSFSNTINGGASGLLEYTDPIAYGTEIILPYIYNDSEVRTVPLKFYVNSITKNARNDEKGTYYEIGLSSPLEMGLKSAVIWEINPNNGISDSEQLSLDDLADHDAVTNFLSNQGMKYYYGQNGYYTDIYPDSGSQNVTNQGTYTYTDGVISFIERYPVTSEVYYNCLTVNASATHSVQLPRQRVTINDNDTTIQQDFQGDRIIQTEVTVTGDNPSHTIETRDWDNDTNICMHYRKVERKLSGYGRGSGTVYMDETITNRDVSDVNDVISSYTIHENTVVKQWGAIITGLQSFVPRLMTVATTETTIHRDADGEGYLQTDEMEIARTQNTGVMYSNEWQWDGTANDYVETTNSIAVNLPAEDYYKLIPKSRRYVTYRRRNGRAFSFEQTWKAYSFVNLVVGGGAITAGERQYILVPDTSAYGFDEVELPEMEEAIDSFSADATYTLDWSGDNPKIEKTITLQNIKINGSGITSQAELQDYLEGKCQSYANKMRVISQNNNENPYRYELSMSVVGASWLPEITKAVSTSGTMGTYQGGEGAGVQSYAVTYTAKQVGLNLEITTLSGGSSTFGGGHVDAASGLGSALVEKMKKLDKLQDNVQIAQVVKPVSSRRFLANVDGKEQHIENINSGPVFNGDSVQAFRSTGTPP
jgi:hypothetical protein